MSDRVDRRPMRKNVRPSRMFRYIRRYGGRVDTLPFFSLQLISADGRKLCEGPALVDDVIVTDKNGRLRTYTEDGTFVHPGRPDLDKINLNRFRGFVCDP